MRCARRKDTNLFEEDLRDLFGRSQHGKTDRQGLFFLAEEKSHKERTKMRPRINIRPRFRVRENVTLAQIVLACWGDIGDPSSLLVQSVCVGGTEVCPRSVQRLTRGSVPAFGRI
ncbi:hypothetical protein BaRGS_00010195 [Batillaria attramentaria]|uniref:Uncharacterized protein n=1 Tax=Batillaria attramentaria TaxID=370345 RepID=A0ABD0LGP4_9CAEN